MRVGFDVRWLSFPKLIGYTRYIFCLLQELQKIPDLELILFTEKNKPVHPMFRDALHSPVVALQSPRAMLWEQVYLPQALHRYGIDVYHAPSDEGIPVRSPCKRVLTSHGVSHEVYFKYMLQKGLYQGELGDYIGDMMPPTPRSLMQWYRRLRHRLFHYLNPRCSDGIIAVSQHTKWELEHFLGLPESKVFVVYEAPDEPFGQPLPLETIEHARQRHGLPDTYMLSVSSLARLKNPQGLLAAQAKLKRQGIHVPLVFIGAVWRDTFDEVAKSHGLVVNRDVFFLQGISDHDLRALYQGAQLYVQLSWRENFGYPMTEAMASGIPVVVSQFAALPEVLGQGGITVDPRNLDDVVGAMSHLLQSTSLQQQYRERARQRSKDFSWSKTANETVAVYEELLRCA